MIKLVASDVDGTLVPDGTFEIDPEIYDVIKKLKEKGITFAAASGRQYASLKKLFAPVADRILYIPDNGGFVRGSKGETWLKRPMEKDLIRAIVEDPIRAIIFDLDGVICFTDQYHYQAWKEMADAEGIYFDETINGRLRGVSRMESLDIILEKASREYTQEEKEQLAARKNESYVRLLEKMSPDDLSQEVKKTLEILRQRGYKLAIGSSSKNTKKILTQIGLNGYFDAISDGTNITKSKPDPEVFLKAAEMLGEKPENCLVVEDALAGIDAAYAGDFQSAGIGDAAGHSQVTYPIQAFKDLLSICSIC